MSAWSYCLLGSDLAFYDIVDNTANILSVTEAWESSEFVAEFFEGSFCRMHMPDEWTVLEKKVIAGAINEIGVNQLISSCTNYLSDGDTNVSYNEIMVPIIGLFVISSGAEMTDEQKKVFMMAAKNDSWSKGAPERKAEMDAFCKLINGYEGTPVSMIQEGLSIKIQRGLIKS